MFVSLFLSLRNLTFKIMRFAGGLNDYVLTIDHDEGVGRGGRECVGDGQNWGLNSLYLDFIVFC